MQSGVAKLRETLAKQRAQSVERSKRVQTWLTSAQAKEFLQKDPELKKIFARARAAAKALPKERAKAIAAQEKRLDSVVAQISQFSKG